MSSFPSKPRLAITVGDPAGIGPEVVLKALADSQVAADCELTVVGSRMLLEQTYRHLRSLDPTQPLAQPDQLSILDIPLEDEIIQQIGLGQGNAASGAASFRFLETAINHSIKGKFHGIVTGPIAKSAWKAAGHHYPGQTELLAERAEVKRFGMMFVARSPFTGWTLRTLLATTHIPLRQVPDVLTPDLMTRKLELLIQCLQQDFGLTNPRIAIAGLNPHSGEQGQLGTEEQDWLIPWLEQTRARLPHLQLDGPVPPDTLWVQPGQAWFGAGTKAEGRRQKAEGRRGHGGMGGWGDREGGEAEGRKRRAEEDTGTWRHGDAASSIQNSKFKIQNLPDAYLALYHDQGLIPVKLMAFDRAVNTTIGLPFVRTSPDHGTAFDIASRGIADANSMKAALELATELCNQKHQRSQGQSQK
ncbi:4-hydroxythreonine-4-phosphate dehydrogenase PdxA [Kovacikia minuta CCNUW1]|uniref:4-hydroxythreonine-4-phosphate dehydrogenase PdxA n=1 Tax=Kovacikia minuta TaxID=2931930 RepID=UPI001CCB2AAE|nr:4-hydroxythreonine-4-phosphate dehydrogenase PdxA [Kovacikia minuta]UBF23752.1 4-hydroxythreonine-4-phosphate dehydrogenase PdxA [Kovacikia minuta CCNUW1]